MNTPRIKTSHPPDQPTPPNIVRDHDWVRQHENELRAQYGDTYVVVYDHAVYGVGQTHQQALDDAEEHLPPEIGQIVVMVESLHRRPPIFMFWPVPTKKE